MLTVLGEQQPAVGNDVEDAATALDQRRLGPGRCLDVSRQTGGL
jgi:hypothetical protein